jgi:hypothetical protein
MSELVPYLAGVVSIMFGIGFFLALQELNKMD